MKATIWHNPGCGTSRKTLEILHDTPGVEVTVVEYLKNPPSADKLAQIYRDAGITPGGLDGMLAKARRKLRASLADMADPIGTNGRAK